MPVSITLVTVALQQGSAVPAFTCYDFTTALAVVAAAEEAGRGAILLVAPKTAATAQRAAADRGAARTRRLRRRSRSPCSSTTPPISQVIADAVAAGADSVLVDGSSLQYEDNIALVRAARAVLDGAGHSGRRN